MKTATAPADEPARASWRPQIEPQERLAFAWATVWFFCILLGYMVVRPLREMMASLAGTTGLQGLMLATFAALLVIVPLYGMLAARVPRRWLVRIVFHCFAACLFGFFVLLQLDDKHLPAWSPYVFFVWVNVYALFATSVFWSVLADICSNRQGKRLFGPIAAGGTLGAITGSLVTSQLASHFSTAELLLLPIATIEVGLYCAWRLEKQAIRVRSREPVIVATEKDVSIAAGHPLAGLTLILKSPYLALICVFLFLVQACGTQLYFQQMEIVDRTIETKAERTQLFAYVDLGAQLLTLLLQLTCSSAILRRMGVSVALVILPLIYLSSFVALAIEPSLAVMVIAIIATRSGSYGITVPAREVLFTVVSREEKYKSKSFIDTVLLRGSDAVAGLLVGRMRLLEFTFSTLNLLIVPVTLLWALVAWRLGNRQVKLAAMTTTA